MYHLLRKQIILLIATLAISHVVMGQDEKEIFRPFHDDLNYYFGMTLGYTSSFLHPSKSTKFLQTDSVLAAEPGISGGLSLGLLATARLNDHFQLRFNPQLQLGGTRSFTYTFKYPPPGQSVYQQNILPTTIVSFPLQVKFNSDRIGNFRTYILGGIKYDYDLSANSAVRNADDLIKLKKSDFGLEAGLGFNFFLRFVTISPEIKFGYGLSNIHMRNPDLIYSSIFDKIQSRMIVFSIHFED